MEGAAKIRAALSVQPCEEGEGGRDRGWGSVQAACGTSVGGCKSPFGPLVGRPEGSGVVPVVMGAKSSTEQERR